MPLQTTQFASVTPDNISVKSEQLIFNSRLGKAFRLKMNRREQHPFSHHDLSACDCILVGLFITLLRRRSFASDKSPSRPGRPSFMSSD